MDAGRLNQRITIKSKSVTRDTHGGETITWATVATVWAAVLPIRGREYVALKDSGAEVTTRFLIRYRAGITPAMQITHDGAVYDVIDVINPQYANRTLELMARAEAVAS
jgi:SPP1 family predicted phage head-tail adaptor